MTQTWAKTTIEDLFEIHYGKGLPKESRDETGGISVYGSNGVIGRHSKPLTRSPVIIIGRKGSVGEVNVCFKRCWAIDTTFFVDRFHCGMPAKYWAMLLRSLRLGQHDKSSAIPGLSREDIYRTEVAVPPLEEQHRIVEKLEQLLAKVDKSKERLERIPAILKRFRQSVLASACSGRLTANWRQDGDNEGDLPANWKWIALEDLLPPGGIFDGPFGSNLKTSDYTESGVRVVRLENVGHLRFLGEKETFISREKYGALKKHTVKEGDIIFASFIDEEIRACLVPKLESLAIAKADCFCVRPLTSLVNRSYLTYQLVSRESFNRLLEFVHGATRPRITTNQLRKLKVRICPLAEQKEIVRRVDARFKIADQIEVRYKNAKSLIDRLTQSILTKAFRGELVPQDPNDEPASELLKRIREERAKRIGKGRGR